MGQALIGSDARALHTPSAPFHNIESAFLRGRADRVTDQVAAKPHPVSKPQNPQNLRKKDRLERWLTDARRGALAGSSDSRRPCKPQRLAEPWVQSMS